MMQPSRRAGSLAWNTAALLVAQSSVPLLNAALIVVLARWAGPEVLGAYALLVTAFLIVDQVRLFGLQRLVTRELAVRDTAALGVFRGFRAIAALGGIAAIPLVMAYGAGAGASTPAAVLFALGLLPSAFVATNDALFLALQRADFTTRVVVLESIFRIGGSLAVLWVRGADLAALAAVFSAGRLLAASLGARYRCRLLGRCDTSSNLRQARALAPQIPAFFSVVSLPLVLLRADLLVVGWIADPLNVGLYSAAARLVAVTMLVPDSFMMANFVRLAALPGGGNPLVLRREIALVLAVVGGVLVPVAGVLALVAEPIAELVYGPAFAEAGTYMAWLIWSLPLFAASRVLGDALVARGHQKRMALVIVGATILSVPLYAVLTAAFGATGVAAAYLGSIACLLCLTAAAARPVFARLGDKMQQWTVGPQQQAGVEAKECSSAS